VIGPAGVDNNSSMVAAVLCLIKDGMGPPHSARRSDLVVLVAALNNSALSPAPPDRSCTHCEADQSRASY